ncbi:hypothetical protein HDU86_008318 [Geranomyces michiganensis]|nr:hypothetical protein HDU86_008318 [Geranomyces michiganensis]
MTAALIRLKTAAMAAALACSAPSDIRILLDLTQGSAARAASRTGDGIKVTRRLASAFVAGLIRNAKDARKGNVEMPASPDVNSAQTFILDEMQDCFGIAPNANDYHRLVHAQIGAGDYQGAKVTLQKCIDRGTRPWKKTLDLFMVAAGAQWDWNGVRWARAASRGTRESHNFLETTDHRMSLLACVNSHIRLSDSQELDNLLERHGCGDAQALDRLLCQGRRQPVSQKRFLQELLRLFCTDKQLSQPTAVSSVGRVFPSWDIYCFMRSINCLDLEDFITILASCSPETSSELISEVANDVSASGFNGKLDQSSSEKIRSAKAHHVQFGGKYLYRAVTAALIANPPQLKAAHGAFVKVRDWPDKLPETVTDRLLRSHLHVKDVDCAMQVFDAATAWGQLLPTATLTWLVGTVLKKNAWTHLWKVLDGAILLSAPSTVLTQLWSPIITFISVTAQKDPAKLPTLLCEFSKMTEQHGVNPDLAIVNAVALAYASAGDPASITRLFEKWKGVVSGPDSLTLEAICRAHLTAGSYGRALEEVEGAVSRGIKPLHMTMNSLISAAPTSAESHRLVAQAETWGLLDHHTGRALAWNEQKHRGLDENVEAVPKLTLRAEQVRLTQRLQALLSSGQIADAERLFDNMRYLKTPCPPNAVTYHIFIHHFANIDVARAAYYLDAMVQSQIEPFNHSYSSLISGYGRSGDLSAAERVLDSMRTAPNAGIFNALIAACSANGDLSGCRKWHRIMTKKYRLQPSSSTFVTLIGAYARAEPVTQKNLRAGMALLKSLEEHPNPLVRAYHHRAYSALIAAFGRLGDTAGAAALWKRMTDFGITPTVESYNAIIGAYAANGHLSDAMRWFEHGFMPSQPGANRMTAALRPDAITFAVLARGHVDANDGVGLSMWLDVMRKMGVVPNAAVKGIVMGWLCRGANQATALQWYLENAISSQPTPATAVEILSGIAENESLGAQAPRAGEEWLKRLTQDGCLVDNVRVLTAMAALYARNGEVEGVDNVLARMRERNVPPNEVTYLTLIDAAAKRGQADLAWRLFEDAKAEAKRAGWPITSPLITALMDASQRAGKLDLVKTCWNWIVYARWPCHPMSVPPKPKIPRAAASVYLDSMASMPMLQETWTFLNERPGHTIDENQACSYVERLIHLGASPEAAIDVLRRRKERGETIGHKIVKNLIGGVLQTAGRHQADMVAESLRDVVGSELVEGALKELQ